MTTIRVDGNDIFAVYNATRAAREIAVKQSRPVLIEAMTYRLGHHSTSDDSTAYRSAHEMDNWKSNDNPIDRLRDFMVTKGWWDSLKDKQLTDKCQKEIIDSLHKAEATLRSSPTDMFNDVFESMPLYIKKQKAEFIDHVKKYKKEYPLNLYKDMEI
jgi:2-oxoisovalerate dehydrogenase E1 component alpha subunit